MKKLVSLMLTLLLLLSCAAASAQTVYTKITVDREVAAELLPAFGVPEEQLAFIDPILALVSALGVNVTTVENGGQVDFDLNGTQTASVGWTADDAGISLVSTLFPNYMVTIQNETIEGMMQQFSANMPGGEGGMGGFDPQAMGEVFGKYYAKWFEACAAAGQPGDPVPGEYGFYGITFDTMVPITVDVPAIKEATSTLMDELLADPAAMAMMKGMAQGMAQSSGEALDDSNFEAQFKEGFEEWMAHFPETVTAEFYTNGEEGVPFYLCGESLKEGSEEPMLVYDMLFEGEQSMVMHCQTFDEGAMEMGFEMDGTDMRMSFSMAEMYFGLDLSFPENALGMDFYFQNPDAPVLCVKVTMAEGGERTLAVDAEDKTLLAVEDAMNDQSAAQGLMEDLQTNGLGALMGAAMSAVPELGALMGNAG